MKPQQQTELTGDLRCGQTAAEKALWALLRNPQLSGLKFRRQHPFGQLVLDFYCAERGLAVDVDGENHRRQPDRDASRDEALADLGLRTLRLDNEAVLNMPDFALSAIRRHIETYTLLYSNGEGSAKPGVRS